MSCDLATALGDAIERSQNSAAVEWFRQAVRRAIDREDHSGFLTDFARAGRKVQPHADGIDVGDAIPYPPRRWPPPRAARCALLLHHVQAYPPEHAPDCIADLYYRGALEERAAVLTALPYLPQPSAYLSLAVDACRTNAQAEFEALAVDNPYPAQHFDDPAFGQLALKAIFIGVPLAGIVALMRRRNLALCEQVAALVRERQAAGRPIRADVEAFLAGDSP